MEHVSSIGRHSRNLVHYLPATRRVARAGIIERYDAIIIHFSVRLPFQNLLDPELANAITDFRGAKIAMPQDEYDLPLITTRRLIELGIHWSLLLSRSPIGLPSIRQTQYAEIDFHPCLTGYVGDNNGIEHLCFATRSAPDRHCLSGTAAAGLVWSAGG